jgi:MHS family alpha-ketoglutarate permease-like MFS transporter
MGGDVDIHIPKYNEADLRVSGRPGNFRNLVAISAGNAIEVFDTGIYAIFSIYFAQSFFTSGNATDDLLSTLGVFAVGFVARPFGGLLFGWLADHKGRQPAMTLSVSASAIGSLIIGVTPTAATIGISAPLVLILARLIQGLAQGGELPAAQTYLAEISPQLRRGLWSSSLYMSGSLSGLSVTVLAAVLGSLLTRQQLTSFGWRAPFLIGAALGILSLIMRRRMRETSIFERSATVSVQVSLREQIFGQPSQLLRVMGLTAGSTILFYSWTVGAVTFAVGQRGTDPTAALWASSAATAILVLALPLWGAFSDLVGRRSVLLFGWIMLAALWFPLQNFIQGKASQLFISMGIALFLVAAILSILPALFAEMLPTATRAIGTGVPYSITVALFGGTAPYLQAYFASQHLSAAYSWWVIFLILISIVTVMFSSETKGIDLGDISVEPN